MHNSHSDRIHMRLFGNLSVTVDERPLAHSCPKKSLLLLVALALHSGHTLERTSIAAWLWPESSDEQARYNLRRALSQLREAMGESAASRITAPTLTTLRLDLDSSEADVVAFDALARRTDISSLERLVTHHQRPLLEGWNEAWVVAERNARQEHCICALQSLAAHETAQGNLVRVRSHLNALIIRETGNEAVDEVPWLALMGAAEDRQQYALALAVYEDMRRFIAARAEPTGNSRPGKTSGFSGEPSAEARTLYHRIARLSRQQTPRQPARHATPIPAGELHPKNDLEAAIHLALQDNFRPTILESEGVVRYLAQQGRQVAVRDWLKDYLEGGYPASALAAPVAWKALARLCVATADFVGAERAIAKAWALFKHAGNRADLAMCAGIEAYLAQQMSDFQRALNCQLKALSLWRELDDRDRIAQTQNAISDIHVRLGNFAAAQTCLNEAVEIHTALGNMRNLAWTYAGVANLAAGRSDYPQVRHWHERAACTAHTIPDPEMVAYLSYQRALDAIRYNDLATADCAIRTALSYYGETENRTRFESTLHAVLLLEGATAPFDLAGDPSTREHAERLARIWGIKQAMREEMGLAPVWSHDCPRMLALVQEAQGALGIQAFTAAECDGKAMSFQQAADYILTGTET